MAHYGRSQEEEALRGEDSRNFSVRGADPVTPVKHGEFGEMAMKRAIDRSNRMEVRSDSKSAPGAGLLPKIFTSGVVAKGLEVKIALGSVPGGGMFRITRRF